MAATADRPSDALARAPFVLLGGVLVFFCQAEDAAPPPPEALPPTAPSTA